MSMKVSVVDLSHYDSVTSFDEVKNAGVVGVIYKATQGGGYVDATYASQRTRALKAGLLWGGYHFGDASNIDAQVSNFLTSAKIDEASLFALDWEENGNNTMSAAAAEAWIQQVEDGLGRQGQCVVYAGSLAKEKLHKDAFFGARRLWLAQYGSQAVLPDSWLKYWLWQYTGDGQGPAPHTVAGIDGDVDCNTYDGPTEQLLAEWATGGVAPVPPLAIVTVTIDAPEGVQVNVVQKTQEIMVVRT